MKFYAVRKGRIPKIYNTWEECEEQVKGFSGAEYKSFGNIKNANEYMGINSQDKGSNNDEDIIHEKTGICIYTDGSFNNQIQCYGSGICIIIDNILIYQCSVRGNKEEYIESRNISGEIMAIIEAIKFCSNHDIHNATIYYDYEGVEKWYTGEWKANKPISKDYISFLSSIQDIIKLSFIKVKSHSNNKYNDLADSLAKRAIDF